MNPTPPKFFVLPPGSPPSPRLIGAGIAVLLLGIAMWNAFYTVPAEAEGVDDGSSPRALESGANSATVTNRY